MNKHTLNTNLDFENSATQFPLRHVKQVLDTKSLEPRLPQLFLAELRIELLKNLFIEDFAFLVLSILIGRHF